MIKLTSTSIEELIVLLNDALGDTVDITPKVTVEACLTAGVTIENFVEVLSSLLAPVVARTKNLTPSDATNDALVGILKDLLNNDGTDSIDSILQRFGNSVTKLPKIV